VRHTHGNTDIVRHISSFITICQMDLKIHVEVHVGPSIKWSRIELSQNWNDSV